MKQSSKTALGGIISALSVMLMFLTAVLPFMTYALPLLAGALLIFMVIEINKKWAFAVYAAVSLLALFAVPDKEAATFYIAFFGYYPIIKSTIERYLPRVVEWVVKLLIFNAAVILAFFLTVYVFGIPFDEAEEFGRYSMLILLGIANVTFFAYDVLLTKLVSLYMLKWRKEFRRIFK